MQDHEIIICRDYWAVDPFDKSTVRVKIVKRSLEIAGFWRCEKADGSKLILASEDFISLDE